MLAFISRFISRFVSRLYVRIWLAVVATVLVLTLAVGVAWRYQREPGPLPIREVQVFNASGQLIGSAQSQADRRPGEGIEFEVQTTDGQALKLVLPRLARAGVPPNRRAPGFGIMLALVALAVALGAYPVIRRLTQRLEALQRGVERWGDGDLSARLDASGQDEVAFLAARFNHAAERIQTLLRSHKVLLANASHELRSPLARIKMGLALMEGGGALNDAAQRSEISRSINELDQLIDEILLSSRLDSQQADNEQFESLDLTGLAAEECARNQAELGISSSGQSLVIQASPRLVRRLIRNLLENARRYSLGAVELELTHTQQRGRDFAVLTVLDRGPGVPAEQRERIFEPFFRVSGASESSGGVGLGLALVKSICTRHGGTVRCDARPGGGAAFVVTLPMLQPVTPAKA